jgi:BTB/POZ domain-containing protein KCTD9
MDERLKKYLDDLFSSYEDLKTVNELKEEMFHDLQDKLSELKSQGHDDETAYRITIDSIGDISEVIEGISAKTRELQEIVEKDFSITDLENSDLTRVKAQRGKFNFSALKGTDFSGSDLSNSIFYCSDLKNVIFDDADLSGAKIVMSELEGASFNRCTLNTTKFDTVDLAGLCFDNQTLDQTIFTTSSLKGASFRNAIFKNVSLKNVGGIKEAIFDGARMDKFTYAVLKKQGANLTNVTML